MDIDYFSIKYFILSNILDRVDLGLVELEWEETKLISGGNGIFYRLGRSAHKAYCYVMDWAMEYEGDPYIKRQMGGL